MVHRLPASGRGVTKRPEIVMSDIVLQMGGEGRPGFLGAPLLQIGPAGMEPRQELLADGMYER
jgi:hypothetical protein